MKKLGGVHGVFYQMDNWISSRYEQGQLGLLHFEWWSLGKLNVEKPNLLGILIVCVRVRVRACAHCIISQEGCSCHMKISHKIPPNSGIPLAYFKQNLGNKINPGWFIYRLLVICVLGELRSSSLPLFLSLFLSSFLPPSFLPSFHLINFSWAPIMGWILCWVLGSQRWINNLGVGMGEHL